MAKDNDTKAPEAPKTPEAPPAPKVEQPPVGYTCLLPFMAWGTVYNKGDVVDIRAWVGEGKTTVEIAKEALKNRIGAGYVELSVNV